MSGWTYYLDGPGRYEAYLHDVMDDLLQEYYWGNMKLPDGRLILGHRGWNSFLACATVPQVEWAAREIQSRIAGYRKVTA